jgi:predicted Ser/Thr protein kinase
MNRLMRGRMALLSAAVLLTLAACGGGDGDATETTATAETTAVEETPTTEAPATETTQAEPADDTGGDDGLSGLSATCLEATQAMAAAMSSYSTGVAGVMGGTLDSEELQQVAEQLEAMASAAPAEIQADLEVIAEELGAFYTALAETGYTGEGTPTAEQIAQLEGLADAIDQDAFDAASDNVNAWFEANCG